MKTGDQYRESINDGRSVYFEGEEIADLNKHPVMNMAVNEIAAAYDSFYDPSPGAQNPLLGAPKGLEALRDRVFKLSESADVLTTTTYQSLATLTSAAPKVGETRPEYVERMYAFQDFVLKEDLRLTECITDAKGNRSASPMKQVDKDVYVRVVDRKTDGIVINGAKLHITGAGFGHYLMVMPTKNMKPGEEDYAVAVAVPVNAPGVKIINTTPAPRGEEIRHFPVSKNHVMPDGFVILDNVFVPYEHVFLDGEGAYAATFAHSLGLWERLGGTAFMADQADVMVGLAQLIAEANGSAGIGHVKEKISEMIIHATLIRGCLEAALVHSKETPDGFVFPDELYTNAAKYHGAANFAMMVRHLHDIGGGAIVTAPSVADLENPELRPFVEKYMATDGTNGEWRTKLFHGIRDLTADSYGGWHLVTNLQSGGGLYAQRLVTRKHYPMDNAKKMALKEIGLANEDGALSMADVLDMFRLDGRTAIVTGSTRGLGRAIAEGFHAAGANVVVSGRKPEGAEQAAAEIGERAVGVGAHLGDEEAPQRLVDAAVERFGGIDIVVNNAAISLATPVGGLTRSAIFKSLDVNFIGAAMLVEAALPQLEASGHASVINIVTSGLKHHSQLLAAYLASKAALSMLTTSMAAELASRGVRVNAISPGPFATDMAAVLSDELLAPIVGKTAMKRLGQPSEIVGAALFLASDASSFATGSTVAVDGGPAM